jgi:hypothetical protein
MGQTEATAKWQAKAGLATKAYKLKKDVAERFAAACAERGESQASVLTAAMLKYIGEKPPKKPAQAVAGCSTRRHRRAAMKRVLAELEQIRCGEDDLANSAPPGLEGAPMYQEAAEHVETLDEALDQLGAIF